MDISTRDILRNIYIAFMTDRLTPPNYVIMAVSPRFYEDYKQTLIATERLTDFTEPTFEPRLAFKNARVKVLPEIGDNRVMIYAGTEADYKGHSNISQVNGVR